MNKLIDFIKKFNIFLIFLLMLIAVGLLIYIILTVPQKCDYVMKHPMQYYEKETDSYCTCQKKIPLEYNYPTKEDYEEMFEDAIVDEES